MKCERVPIGLLVLWVAMGFNVSTYKTIAQEAAPSEEQIAALLAKAKAGDVYSQLLVGQAYENKQDYEEAVIWLRKAAESGNVLAQDHLAYLYDAGNGIPQDDVQAVFWLRKAADQGDPWAQSSLGTLYSEGHGVRQDYDLAAFWWRKAATQGDVDAQKALTHTRERQIKDPATWAYGPPPAGITSAEETVVQQEAQNNPIETPSSRSSHAPKETSQDVIASPLQEAKTGQVKTIFTILSVLNDLACALTLALFLLFYRKPAKKGTPEEVFIEKQQFKGHWIILAFWLLGTIVVGSFEVNVLWVALFIVVGAYIASSSKSSAAAIQLAISRTQNPARNPELHKANASVGVYCTICATPQPVTARFCAACGAKIATAPFAQPSSLRHPMPGRIGNPADRLVIGWFVLLFLWNFFARTGPSDRPVAVHLFEAAEYFLSIFEIVLTIGVVWLIYRFTRTKGN
jgi:hypothetical protein